MIGGYTTGPDTAPWPPPPAGYGLVVSGTFVDLVRPSIGRSYVLPNGGITVSNEGLDAAYLDRSKDGGRITVLDVESGAAAFPALPSGVGVALHWAPQSAGRTN